MLVLYHDSKVHSDSKAHLNYAAYQVIVLAGFYRTKFILCTLRRVNNDKDHDIIYKRLEL